jgi:hypothetical protein
MTAQVDPHIQALRDALVAEHEETVARAQKRADEAAARGDEWYRKWHQGLADRLKAMRYPWASELEGTNSESTG